jgi:hypothetical protein
VEGELRNDKVQLPISFASAVDARNISGWKLKINGKESDRYLLKADDSGILLRKRGFVILYR